MNDCLSSSLGAFGNWSRSSGLSAVKSSLNWLSHVVLLTLTRSCGPLVGVGGVLPICLVSFSLK